MQYIFLVTTTSNIYLLIIKDMFWWQIIQSVFRDLYSSMINGDAHEEMCPRDNTSVIIYLTCTNFQPRSSERVKKVSHLTRIFVRRHYNIWEFQWKSLRRREKKCNPYFQLISALFNTYWALTSPGNTVGFSTVKGLSSWSVPIQGSWMASKPSSKLQASACSAR